MIRDGDTNFGMAGGIGDGLDAGDAANSLENERCWSAAFEKLFMRLSARLQVRAGSEWVLGFRLSDQGLNGQRLARKLAVGRARRHPTERQIDSLAGHTRLFRHAMPPGGLRVALHHQQAAALE